jgi:prevent-host-death family protein
MSAPPVPDKNELSSVDILRPSVTFLLYMKTATVRQLRHDFGTVLTWVEQGEAVEISKRGRIIALLSPPLAPKPVRPKKRPDFIGRLQRIYGDRVLAGNIVVADRESRSY